MTRPTLSLVLVLQPQVLEGLSSDRALKGRGLYERFLWVIPENTVGRRKIRGVRPVPEHCIQQYEDLVRTLARFPEKDDPPVMIQLSPEAREEFLQFCEWLEPQLSAGGELEQIVGWASKAAGTVGRIAGLLHCSSTPGFASTRVSGATIKSAIRIGMYFLEHAKIAFAGFRGGALDPAVANVWKCIERKRWSEFSSRELQRAVTKSLVPDATTLEAALKDLEIRGRVRKVRVSASASRVGRPMSSNWEVNPTLLKS